MSNTNRWIQVLRKGEQFLSHVTAKRREYHQIWKWCWTSVQVNEYKLNRWKHEPLQQKWWQRGIEHRFHAVIVEEIWGIPMLWRFNIGMISQWNYCSLTSNKQNFRIINNCDISFMNITDQGYLQSISRCDIAEPVVLIMFSLTKDCC